MGRCWHRRGVASASCSRGGAADRLADRGPTRPGVSPPEIPLFRDNTAAFIHDLPAEALANAAGDSNHVRVQVLTSVKVLDRDKQLGVVKELTEIVAAWAGDPSLSERTWVLITEVTGGWLGDQRPCEHQRGHRRLGARCPTG